MNKINKINKINNININNIKMNNIKINKNKNIMQNNKINKFLMNYKNQKNIIMTTYITHLNNQTINLIKNNILQFICQLDVENL